MKILSKNPTANPNPKKLSEIWYQHHSPIEIDIIKPQTYKEIYNRRLETMSEKDAKQYILDRAKEEKSYLPSHNNSYTYASIVGFNKMELPLSYPGFTYYFQLNAEQVAKTLFGVVGKENIKPELGLKNLMKCIHYWNDNKNNLTSYLDPIVGIIDPRIEVIIPFDVKPIAYIPEQEQR